MSGIAEGFFENYSLEKLFSLKAPKTKKQWVMNVLKQMFTEGSEEFNTDIANAVADKIIMADKSDYETKKKAYMDSGMSEKEADKQASIDFAKQLGMSFLGGAVSGGLFGAGSNVLYDTNARSIGADIRSQGKNAVKKTIADAKHMGKGTESFAYASGKDSRLSDRELGYLAQQLIADQEIQKTPALGYDLDAMFTNAEEVRNAVRGMLSEASSEALASAESADAPASVKNNTPKTEAPSTANTAAPVVVSKNEITRREKLADPTVRLALARAYGDSWAQHVSDDQINAMNEDVRKTKESRKTEEQAPAKDQGIDDTMLSSEERVKADPVLSAVKARETNVEFRDFKDQPDPNLIGFYDRKNNTIVLNKNAKRGDGRKLVSLHELTHRLEQTDSYQTLRRMATDVYAGDQALENAIAGTQAEYRAVVGQKLSREEALQELTAKYVSELLSSDDKIAQIVKDDRPLAKKILDTIRQTIQDLKVRFKGGEEAELLSDLRRAEKALAKALDESEQKNTAGEGGRQYSLLHYSDSQIANWKNSKSIVIYENETQFNNFIDKAAKGEDLGKKMYFGTIPPRLAEWIKSETGVDVTGYNCTLRASEVRKVLKDHGSLAKEDPRGQRAITEEDFANIPIIITSPDEIRLSPNRFEGKPVIEFVKTINGKTTVAAYTSQKHFDLTVQTMYSGKNKRSLATAADEQASANTPEAHDGTTPSDPSKPQKSTDVNTHSMQNAEENAQAEESSDAKMQYSIRKLDPPEKTGKAYKVFYAKDGKLYPPMVANPNGEGTPAGVWLDADIGASAPASKTGRLQVQGGGKGTSTGKTSLSFRPGWHLGDIPLAKQFARTNPETGKKDLFPSDFVWAECEYAMDKDYQDEAMSYGNTENGKFRHSYAGLPKIPTDGYYRYRTNPNPDTVPWVITGAMKVNRILTDAETDAICRENGVEPMKRQGGPIDLEKFGLKAGDVQTEEKTAHSYSLDRLNDDQIEKEIQGLIERFGAFEPGVNPTNEISLPQKVGRNKNVNRFSRTAIESQHAGEEVRKGIMRRVVDGTLVYVPESDKGAVNAANATLNQLGYEGAKAAFEHSIGADSNGTTSKNNIVLGERLLVEAAKNGKYDEVMDYIAKLAVEGTRAGQLVQALSILKKMGPEGQLLALQQHVNKWNRKEAREGAGLKRKQANRNQIDRIDGEIKDSKSKIAAGEKAQADAERVISDLTAELKKLDGVPDAIRNKIFKLEERIQQKAGDVVDGRAAAEKAQAETQARFDELTGILKELREDRAKLKDQKRSLEGRNFTAERRVQDTAGDIIELERILTGAKQKLENSKKIVSELNMTKKALKELEKKRAELAGNLVISQEMIDDIMSQTTQRGLDKAMQRAYAELGKQAPSTWIDKWNAWRYMSMLVNVTTHVRNVLGNAFFIPVMEIKNALAVPMQKAITENAEKGIYHYAAFVNNTPVDQAYKKLARESFADNETLLMSSGKYNPSNVIRDNMTVFKTGVLEYVRKKNNDLLEAEDLVFLRRAYVNAYARFLKANQYSAKSEAQQKAIANMAQEWASNEAWKATYRDASALADTIASLARKGAGWNIFVNGVLPFKKTPINIAKRGVEYSPLGLMKGGIDVVKAMKGSADADGNLKVSPALALDEICSGLTGSMIFAFGYFLAQAGILAGTGDDDEKKRAYDKAIGGKQNYSVRTEDINRAIEGVAGLFGHELHLENGTYTLDWMAPTSLPLFTGVELWNQTNELGGWSADTVLKVLGNSVSPMVEMSMLSSLDDMISAAGYGKTGGEKLVNMATDALTSYFGQAVPTFGGKINRIIDGTVRNSYYNDKTTGAPNVFETFWRAAVNKLPGASYSLEPKIDVWGREIKDSFGERTAEALISPGSLSKSKMTLIDKEIMRLYDGLEGDTDAQKKVIPNTKPDSSFSVEGKPRYLSASEYTRYCRERGTAQYNMLSTMFNSGWYKKLSEGDKADAIEKVYGFCGYAAAKHIDYRYTNKNYDKAYSVCTGDGIPYVDYYRYYTAAKSESGTHTIESVTNALDKATGLNQAQKIALFDAWMPNAKKNPYEKMKLPW